MSYDVSNPNALTASQTFKYFDKNKDGKIDARDMKILSGGDNVFNANEMKGLFKNISGQNMNQSLLGANAKFTSQNLTWAFDQNNDGRINFSDFQTIAGRNNKVDATPLEDTFIAAFDKNKGYNDVAQMWKSQAKFDAQWEY